MVMGATQHESASKLIDRKANKTGYLGVGIVGGAIARTGEVARQTRSFGCSSGGGRPHSVHDRGGKGWRSSELSFRG